MEAGNRLLGWEGANHGTASMAGSKGSILYFGQ